VPFDFSTADYLPASTAGPLWALFSVAVLGIGPGSIFVLMFLQARRLAAVQAREHAHLREEAERPLVSGPGHVVSGRVELDNSETIGVQVDITQEVKNHTSKNSRWHTWNEVARTVRPGPFYLVREGLPPVYVEPDENALVVDTLETSYPLPMASRRIRTADVKVGESFFAYGDLQEGPHPRARDAYRGSAMGWVLRPPRRGRMLLATEGIRDRYKDRVSYLWKSGIICGAIFLGLHAWFTLPFVAATVLGTRTTAEVVRTDTYVTHHKNSTTRHYELITRSADGFELTQDVPSFVYDRARDALARGDTVVVPIVRTRDWKWASFVGPDPYVSGPWIVMGVICFAITLLAVRGTYKGKYAWYDKKKLSEHGGSGHWTEPRPSAPVPPGTN
jgi:hypothetical protein